MKTILVSLLLVSAFLVAVAPTAEAAYYPCTSLIMDCPALFCRSYDPRTGYRAHCVGEPIQCVTEPCWGYVLP